MEFKMNAVLLNNSAKWRTRAAAEKPVLQVLHCVVLTKAHSCDIYKSVCHLLYWGTHAIIPDSLRMSGLAKVIAAVKSLPLYSVSNCHVTNCACWVYKKEYEVSPHHIVKKRLIKLEQYCILLLTWNTALALIFSLRWNKECAFKLPEESISPISIGESFIHRRSLDCKFIITYPMHIYPTHFRQLVHYYLNLSITAH